MSEFELYPYQKQALETMDAFQGRVLLAFDMGLGKTPTVLCWLQQHPEVERVLIVCPASVKLYWQRMATAWIGWQAKVGEGLSPPTEPITERMLILNWDILWSWREAVRRWNPDTVVLDEVHLAANRRAKRTKAAKLVTQAARYRFGLSGTPLVNRPAELWSTLNMLRPDVWSAFWPYATRYCNARRTRWGWDVSGATKLPELHEQLRERVMIRRLKSEVLQDLPPKIRTVVPMQPHRRSVYDRARDNLISWLREWDWERAERARRAEALVRISYLLELAAKIKLRSVIQWIEEWLQTEEGQLVVWTWHRGMTQVLQQHFTALLIDGSVTPTQRQTAVDRFVRGEQRVLVGQIRAAGTGVDGLQVASACVFTELCWRPGDILQAEDRLHRIGQQEVVNAFYLISPRTIEERLCDVIQRKQGILSTVLDGQVNEDQGLQVWSQLLEVL